MYTEEITVYKNVPVENDNGGFTTSPQIQLYAPTWASITQTSGSQDEFSTRDRIVKTFTVECNVRNDFSWDNEMYISSRFGNLQVIGIEETVRKKKMTITAQITNNGS